MKTILAIIVWSVTDLFRICNSFVTGSVTQEINVSSLYTISFFFLLQLLQEKVKTLSDIPEITVGSVGDCSPQCPQWFFRFYDKQCKTAVTGVTRTLVQLYQK
jgi:hypothetical protein